MVKEEPVFRIEYECINCGKKFSERYYKREEVSGDGWNLGIKVKSHLCTGGISCPHCKTIECPNCESEKVTINKREVI